MKFTAIFGVAACTASLFTTLESAAAAADHCPAAQPSYPPLVDAKIDALNFAELKRLADKGDAGAQALVGLRYAGADGTTDVAPDIKKAVEYFQRSATKSHALGEYLLGVVYMSGAGVEKDEARAFDLFKRSGEHGHANGNYWVGEMTAKGRGFLVPSWEQALPSFSAAAAGGAPDAYVELGYMYERGLGNLKVDYEKAAYCYRQGGLLKSQTAQYNVRILIDKGLTAWQTGDPGAPPNKPQPYRVK